MKNSFLMKWLLVPGHFLLYADSHIIKSLRILLSSADPSSFNEYEYVIPKSDYMLGATAPGTGNNLTVSSALVMNNSPRKLIPSHPTSPHLSNRYRTIQLRFRGLGLPEISRRRLKMVRKLGDGVFGTVCKQRIIPMMFMCQQFHELITGVDFTLITGLYW
jgi:hypothetical protein